MKNETVGTLAAFAGLLSVSAVAWQFNWLAGAGCALFAGGMVFQTLLSKAIRAVAVVALFAAAQAKALFMFVLGAVVIGAAAGLILWGIIDFVYRAMSIHPMLQRPEIAMISVTDTPEVILAAAEPEAPEVMTVAPKLSPVVLSSLYGISAMVPEGWTILYSTNLIDWEEPPPNVIVDERPEGYWKAVPRE